MDKVYNLCIVDDHPLVAEGLRMMLSEVEDVYLMASFKTGKDFLMYPDLKKVHIVLLDVFLPDTNGIDLCLRIKRTYPGKIVLAISSQAERSIITQMIKNGADGYLLKSAGLDEFKYCIRSAIAGKKAYSAEVSEILHKATIADLQPIPRLTKREKEILNLLRKGKSTQEISDLLFLSYLTVQTHRRNLLNKFGLKNVVELINFCSENALL